MRFAETSLSVEQLKEAGKLLIAMDVTGVPESGNAIAAALRKLGEDFKADIEEAERHSNEGLPVPDSILKGEAVLSEPVKMKDPTKAAMLFLQSGEEWKTLHEELKTLRIFLDAKRHQTFKTSRQIADLTVHHPLPAGHAGCAALEQAMKDMDTMIENRDVLCRWPDYRASYEAARDAYRTAYVDAYGKVRNRTRAALHEIQQGTAYEEAPFDRRDEVIEEVFGPGGACHYKEINLQTTPSLLDAAAKHSLTSLAQALVAIPGYKSRVETELRNLSEPPEPPGEKVVDWSPGSFLAGRRFKSEKDVDRVLKEIADDIKKRIREGFTVVVK